MTQAGAARAMGVTPRTVRRWLRLESPIVLELIGDSPKLAIPFARCWALLMRRRERSERNGGNGNGSKRTAPRMARARRTR